MIEIIQASSDEHTIHFRRLVTRYAEEMGFDLRHPRLSHEIEHLPGEYSPPGGFMLLALEEGEVVGSVALRSIDAETCEIRRLYVVPRERGAGTARGLMFEVMKKASEMGYQKARLITLPSMLRAIELYRGLGFRYIEPYRETTDSSARFMEINL